MSHKKLREEKNCLNCGHMVEERYCTHCGQENLQLQDSFFHLIIHYIQDMFHYDGKFWHTLKTLIRKPGQVAREYMEGKRSHNLEPLRFYVFASTVFFLLFFLMIKTNTQDSSYPPKLNYKKRLFNLDQEKKFLQGSPDTAYVELLRKGVKEKIDSINISEGDTVGAGNLLLNLSLPTSQDTSVSSGFEKWMEHRAEERRKELAEKHEGDESSAFMDIIIEAMHKLPQLLFLSLPFFALFLKILYIRPRRTYVEHFIFSVYFFAYMFVMMGILFLINFIPTHNATILNMMTFINVGIPFYLIIYLMLAMKRFYNDRWRYLIPRYIFLSSLFFTVLLILFLINVVVTYMW